MRTQVQTIELTGKRFKGQQVLAVLLMLASIYEMFAGAEGRGFMLGTLGLAIGFLWMMVVKVQIWWYHR